MGEFRPYDHDPEVTTGVALEILERMSDEGAMLFWTSSIDDGLEQIQKQSST